MYCSKIYISLYSLQYYKNLCALWECKTVYNILLLLNFKIFIQALILELWGAVVERMCLFLQKDNNRWKSTPSICCLSRFYERWIMKGMFLTTIIDKILGWIIICKCYYLLQNTAFWYVLSLSHFHSNDGWK